MTTITAKIIADSISPDKIRLTTIQLRYPRFIHAELMTHRVFSRNASSSRAVPVEKLIEDIMRDTAMPIHWGKNQKGMQANEECNNDIHLVPMLKVGTSLTREEAWVEARDRAIEVALSFNEAGYHKQIVNRLLEPFSHINVLVTSIYWANWFKLRNHPDAQPEICKLAQEMKVAMNESTPQVLQPGEWHLPYVTNEDILDGSIAISDLPKVSAARCARVSYLTHDMKEPNVEADMKLFERLAGSEPLHASPLEHIATPDTRCFWEWEHKYEQGNFWGWRQYRKMLKGEFENEYA